MLNPNHHPHNIVFDFGGVLVDWNPRHLYRKLFNGDEQAVERFLDEIGFVPWNLEMDRGRSFAESVADLSRQFPQYADLIRAYDLRWEESVPGPIQPTVNILHTLKHAGYRLYGLSNWSHEKFQLVRPRYAFFDWFDAIVISGDVKMTKPDPRIYHTLLARIGQPADACVFIDDSETNIAMARQLGFATIHYQSPEQLQRALNQLGVAC
ncbi:MAG: HAD family phosphatase [Chloroflexi bacterium]|nr:HAD family phosphatase [Chloroflexota bacterium]